MKKNLLIFFAIFKVYFFTANAYQYELAICAIFQHEAAYLREWIEFHKLVGVQHFYLYNNLSQDQYYKELLPYLRSGEVDLIDWNFKTNPGGDNWPTIQCTAYRHAINHCKNKVKWLAIIDTDEFLFPVQTMSLLSFLETYEEFAAVTVNWQMYGTSFVKNLGSGHLLIEDLIYKAHFDYPENCHVKSIVRPEFVNEIGNPHFCDFLPGFFQVNANKESFFGPYSSVLIDKIRINHYWTRDEYFFYRIKLARRSKWQDSFVLKRAESLNQEIDTSIFKYVPRLKEILNDIERQEKIKNKKLTLK